METLILLVCLLLAGMCLTLMTLAAAVLWRCIGGQQGAAHTVETPEETEVGLAAAEAQRRYEQGFFNLMQYDGRPGREKEREDR